MQVHELYNLVSDTDRLALIDSNDMLSVVATGEDCLYYGHNLIRSIDVDLDTIIAYVYMK